MLTVQYWRYRWKLFCFCSQWAVLNFGFSDKFKIFVSVTKFIRISIADKNDNPPYFDKHLYEAEVDENEDIQHTVLTVTANDKDECKLRNNIKCSFGMYIL